MASLNNPPAPASKPTARLEVDFRPNFQSAVDAYQKLLGSIAITAALFAGVMISLAQMIQTEDAQTTEDWSTAWKALSILTYYSISANLVAAGSAVWATIYLAWMPLCTPMPHVNVGDGNGNAWGTQEEAASMVRENRGFRFQYSVAVSCYGLGLVLAFAAILMWVWLSMSPQHTEGIALLVLVVPGFLCTAWPLFRAVLLTALGKNPWMVKLPHLFEKSGLPEKV